jgi:hypothetical protein
MDEDTDIVEYITDVMDRFDIRPGQQIQTLLSAISEDLEEADDGSDDESDDDED